MTTRVIPSYALYGEQSTPGWQSSFDFEWIPQRSRPYNWEIRPHKHDAFLQILYLTQGTAELQVDHAKFSVHAPCLLQIPAQTVHAFSFSDNIDGPVVTAAQRPLESLVGVAMAELLPSIRKPVVLPLEGDGRHAEMLMPLFLSIEREAHLLSAGQVNAGMALVAAVCVQIARLAQVQQAARAHGNSRKTVQIEKFRAMVDARFRQHLPITAYADPLGITPGQLSRLCREVLGMSSLDVVNARLVHEAQRELVYTSNSIQQLADSLGFADEAYFGRFFRKHTGLSPRAFRTKALESMLVPEPDGH